MRQTRVARIAATTYPQPTRSSSGGGGGLVYMSPQVTAPTYTIEPGTDVVFNSTDNAQAFTATSSRDGDTFRLSDGAAAVSTHEVTLVDADGYQFENPSDNGLYDTITWGPGSGGDPNPNLTDYQSVTYRRTTRVVASVSTTFWQAVGWV